MPLCSIRNCMQYKFFTMCACKDTVLFFPSETESSFLSTCKNHLYLKRRFFQDITYTDLWRREHSSYVQKFLRFVTGKKIRRHAFYVKCVFEEVAKFVFYKPYITWCYVQHRSVVGSYTMPMQDMELQILCASASIGI